MREPSLIPGSVSQFHQTLHGLEGVGDGEPYSEPSQQVEEAEVTGESFTHCERREQQMPCVSW